MQGHQQTAPDVIAAASAGSGQRPPPSPTPWRQHAPVPLALRRWQHHGLVQYATKLCLARCREPKVCCGCSTTNARGCLMRPHGVVLGRAPVPLERRHRRRRKAITCVLLVPKSQLGQQRAAATGTRARPLRPALAGRRVDQVGRGLRNERLAIDSPTRRIRGSGGGAAGQPHLTAAAACPSPESLPSLPCRLLRRGQRLRIGAAQLGARVPVGCTGAPSVAVVPGQTGQRFSSVCAPAPGRAGAAFV